MVWTKFSGKRILGNVCHWLVMKQSSIFKAQKSMSSRILCCASGGSFNIRIPTKLGKTRIAGSNPEEAAEIMMVSMESRLNSSGTSSQDSQRFSSVVKSIIYWATWDKYHKLTQEEFYICSTTSLVTEKATKMNAWQVPESSKYLRENLVLDNGHLLDQVLKRSGFLQRIVHKELGIKLRNKWCWNSQKADILFSVQRLHCPGVLSKARSGRKQTSYFPCNDSIVQRHSQEQRTWKTVDTLRCRWTYSWYNLSHYSFCQSAQSLRSSGSYMWRIWEPIKMDRGNLRFWWVNQFVLGDIKAEVPLQNENSMNHQILWKQ